MSNTPTISPVQIPTVGSTENIFHVEIGFPGLASPTTVQLDTGSIGIVLSASLFYEPGTYNYVSATNTVTGTLLPGITIGDAVTVTYQPSSNDINGFYYTIDTLQIGFDANNQPVALASSIQVVGATSATPHMMGIGFGRPKSYGQNPFLNINGMDSGAMYASMLLTTQGIWLGCTPSQAAMQLPHSTFGFQKLSFQGASPQPLNSSQWTTPTGNFSVTGATDTQTNDYTILVDTGLELMMLESGIASSYFTEGAIVTVGIPVIPNNMNVSYSFEITGTAQVQLGSGSTLTNVYTTSAVSGGPTPPTYVAPIGSSNFVNTGIHLLSGYQLFFDAVVGQVGYAAYPA